MYIIVRANIFSNLSDYSDSLIAFVTDSLRYQW